MTSGRLLTATYQGSRDLSSSLQAQFRFDEQRKISSAEPPTPAHASSQRLDTSELQLEHDFVHVGGRRFRQMPTRRDRYQ